jgi:hypothetical protein
MGNMNSILSERGGTASAPAPAVAAQNLPIAAKRNWLSEATVLAAIPVATYVVTFAYHAGYAQFFGVPTELISIDTKMFLIAALPVILIVHLLLSMSLTVFGFWREGSRSHPFYRRLTIVFPSFASSLAYMLISFSHWHQWIVSVLVTLFLVALFFGMPLLFNRNEKSWIKRLEIYDKSQANDTVAHLYMRQELGTLLIGMMWVWIVAQIAYTMGGAIAENQRRFFVRSTTPETVILCIYGDYQVTAPFDRSKKTVQKKISVVKITDTPIIPIQSEDIGPLHPQ